ncbi:MAG: EAL domain-containing protein [Acidimicrobiales bacterium]|jgi:EAL domain-containing protein (putative c-di-GMP-specific phosphodiesterase class I)
MANESESSRGSGERGNLTEELEKALENQEFFLVYLPEIDLRSNAFVGVEALIRWRHPRRGVLGPDDFVPELESSGLILAVGRWALFTACAQGAEWHDKGYRFTVSVNISALQFAWSGFIGEVDEALSSSRFPSGLLVLEFAQGTLAGESADHLDDLMALGVRLAVDDFEPGQSLLSDLENLPIAVVKLDRHFVSALSKRPQGAELVHALVELAKKSKVQIVASGIEDADQRQRLQLEDVGVGQGFLFSKPHEAAEIDRYLEDFSIFSGKPL